MKQNLYLFSPRCFVFLLLFCATFAFAQTPVYSLNDDSFVPAINRSLTSPCAATIYDPQGAAGYYLPNQQVVTTYCPDAPNKRMKIDFTMCNLSTGDTLKVYDGNSTTAPLLTTFTGYHNFTQRVVATAANTQSCLTLAFSSNAVGESYGYTGTINCQRICQPIEPSFIISATVPTYPTVAGDSAVNICVGQSVTLTAAAMYPENDVFYHQNDTTTRYLIDWADGRNTLITSAPPHTATHQYNGGSIYFPRIIATEPDSGCFSISPRNLRLRVADKPYFTIHQPASICLGDTVNLLPTVVSTFNPIAVCDPFPIITGNIGTFCISDNGGTADTYTMNNLNYRSIPVNKYERIRAVYASFQHSFAGDLKIELVCPNGNSIILKDYSSSNSSGAYFGVANDMMSSCSEDGQGLTYAWINSGVTGIGNPYNSYYQGIGGVNIPYTMPILDTLTMNSALATNTHLVTISNPYMNTNSATLEPAYYKPDEPMSLLYSCPVNGDWKLKITDNTLMDNGILYKWGILFDEYQHFNGIGHTPVSTGSWICSPTTVGGNCAVGTPIGSASMTIAPTADTTTYHFKVDYPGYPCSFDTSVKVIIKPFLIAPQLGSPIICPGHPTDLVATTANGDAYDWSTGEQTSTITVAPTVTTIYTVTVASLTLCQVVASATVTVDSTAFTIDATGTPDTSQVGNGTAAANLFCSSASASYAYQWSNGAITPTIMNLIAGVYTVTVTSSTGATYTAQVVVGNFTKTDKYDDNTISVVLQPNPTEGNTLLKAVFETPTASTLLIYNPIGQLIFSKENAATTNLEQAISLETQAAGVYFISLKTNSGLLTQRLVLIK